MVCDEYFLKAGEYSNETICKASYRSVYSPDYHMDDYRVIDL